MRIYWCWVSLAAVGPAAVQAVTVYQTPRQSQPQYLVTMHPAVVALTD